MALLYQMNLTSSFVITALKGVRECQLYNAFKFYYIPCFDSNPTLSYGFLWYQVWLCFLCSFLQWICPNKSFLVERLAAELDKSTVRCPMYSCVVQRILKTQHTFYTKSFPSNMRTTKYPKLWRWGPCPWQGQRREWRQNTVWQNKLKWSKGEVGKSSRILLPIISGWAKLGRRKG